MRRIKLALYRDNQGHAPLREWLRSLPDSAKRKCIMCIDRLSQFGLELDQSEAEYLRDNIYALHAVVSSRLSIARNLGLLGLDPLVVLAELLGQPPSRQDHHVLYFFDQFGRAIVSHGLRKTRQVSNSEIDRALSHKQQVSEKPRRHSIEEYEVDRRAFVELPETVHRKGTVSESETDAFDSLYQDFIQGHSGQAKDEILFEHECVKASIAQQIRQLRHDADVTQKQLAKLVGVRQSVIAQLEQTTYSRSSFSMFVQIGAMLGKKVDLRYVPRFAR